MKGIFHPQYFAMHQQFALLDVMSKMLSSQIEVIRNTEAAKACQKAAEDQAQFQIEMYRQNAELE